MGVFMSRRNAGVQEVDISVHNAYKYPPKSGSYFGSHFIMGGERFDTILPEAYLFGENQDLNFLGSRPIPFPYPAPQCNEPTKTLRSLVNIRKDSLRFIKVQDNENNADRNSVDATENGSSTKYNLEFTFDSDVRCAITIYYFATEEFSNGQMVYHPRDATMNSETFHYKRGANQTFSQTTHIIDPSKFPDEEWLFSPEKDTVPVVIQCCVEEEHHIGHAHITFGCVEKNSENVYILKPLKQKQTVDGLCYLLQEIYGIENKNAERKANNDDDFDDNGSECVICMSDTRDTLILPCRHLCLCNGCANNLRYQANNCPICRAPFRALLQIRALRKKLPNTPQQPPSEDETPVSQEGVPTGYEAVALIEALNGATNPAPLPNPLQMPAEGLPPPTRPSLAGSPHESPVLEKTRKVIKRQPSVGSRSLRDAAVPEEAEETKEGGEAVVKDDVAEGRGTPEVVMFAMAPEPIKPTETVLPTKKASLPKIRFPGTKARASPDDLEDPLHIETEGMRPQETMPPKVEIINETGKLGQESLRYSNCRQLTEETNVSDSTSESEECEMHEASAVTPEASSPTLEHGIQSDDDSLDDVEDEDVIDDDGDEVKPMNIFRQAAHTKVLYEREDDIDEEKMEQESLVINLPHDTMSLPGTPVGTDGSSGSSYGSTSSTRMLLPQGQKPDDDKVETYKPTECV
ncbi:probable E3 ubiquitin-protein ligase MGRN1 isoform X2 [Lineus longissimus]|uniref:probable E3 ubiquitin-protein ligase MGRN1 isoform X2 n=1 Tax=Lineus longissimus TaxID=88925 RepID=UPI002B4F2561